MAPVPVPAGRGEARDAEVHDLRGAVFGEEDVRGLDVAVDDAHLVGVAQALEDLQNDGDPPRDGQGRHLLHGREQVATPQELHDDVGRAVRVVAEVVDRHHVGVGEPGHRAGLALEALLVLGMLRDLGEHHLQGDLALEERVERLVDDAHASAAAEGHDLVLADVGAGPGLASPERGGAR